MNYAQVFSDWVKGALLTELKPEQRRALPLIVSGAASEEQMAAAGTAFVLGIKEAAKFSTRSTVAGPIEKAKAGEHVIPWILSDASSDRMGDVINPDGWRLEHFRKNPVILWGHGGGGVLDGDEPIGRAERVRVEKGQLVADIRFAFEESDRAARKFRLANSGYIKAGSVGFKPVKVERVDDEDERRKLGLGKFGVLYKEQELLEFSLVAVPANPHALQQSVKAGEIEAGDADWLAAYAAETVTERDLERSIKRKLIAIEPAPAAESDKLDTALIARTLEHDENLRKLLAIIKDHRDGDASARLWLESVLALRNQIAQDALDRAKDNESRHAIAASLAMVAKALTDFSGQLSSLRAATQAPSAQAEPAEKLDALAIINAINEQLQKRK